MIMRSFLSRLTFSILYYFNPPWDSGVSPPELLDFIKKHPSATLRQSFDRLSTAAQGGRAIDIGCGTGTNVITLAQAGWQVTGVDFVPRAIRMARRKARKAGIEAELVVRDVTNLKGIHGPFDLALDIGCFHSLGDQKAGYLSELNRILAPGGHWLMYGFIKPTDQTGPGLAEADLNLIPASMSLVWRQDGFNRGEQPSAWFLYQKAPALYTD
jgi:ubiquinone/menaquinone biosynthesis C-methylase UbiE